jgi:hypothetical protein
MRRFASTLILASSFSLAAACVISDGTDSDTDAGSGGSDTDATASGTTSTASSTTSSASTTADTDASTSTASGTTTAGATTDTDTDTDTGTGTTTGGANACGWGVIEPGVEGYICGGDGEDPLGMVPFDCPAGALEGDPCGDVTEFGCCTAAGDVLFCNSASALLVAELCDGGGTDTDTTTGTGTDTDAPSGCGWGVVQPGIEGYICGGEGEDPQGVYPLACPPAVLEGDPCGDVTDFGCCDPLGDLYFCDATSGTLVLETCG